MILRIAFVSVLLTLSIEADSHHSTAATYDRNNMATIEGEVVSIFWKNPHVILTIERVAENGARETWTAESGSANSLARIGVSPDIVAVGDHVMLLGALSRKGQPAMAAFTMTLADGTETPLWPQRAVTIGREVRPAPFSSAAIAAGERTAHGIFRIWSRPGPGLSGDLPYSAKALAARGQWDPLEDDPALRCEPPGMPSMMDNPYPIEFIDHGNTVELRLEEWDGVRTIHMEPGASDAGQAATPKGYSIGRWDSHTLVVTTSHVSDPYFDSMGTPQSPQSKIVEQFALNAAEDRLDYRVTVTDPETFTGPATLTGTWVWRPGEEIKEFNCSLR